MRYAVSAVATLAVLAGLAAPAWVVVVCAVLTAVGSVAVARYGGQVRPRRLRSEAAATP